MGIKYDNSEFVVPSARNTSNRSVCDFNEQEAASVLLSLAGRNSSVNRCTVDEMDRSICLCLPSTDNSKQSITKNTERGLCNFTDSANVAETVVVQSTSQPVNRLSNTTACPTKSIKSKWNSSSKSKCSKSCSLESVKRSYTAKGFSPKIASIISNARKQSTQTVYNARLKLFDSWCQERSINPSTSTVPEIAEFLMFLHTVKNCKPSTLAGYKSAIALIHSSKDRISINMDLSNLIKGLYNINPPIRQLAPNWDLSLVLLVLTKTPFEPLEEAELKYLTLKTVFLMALASAARVSELHSFTINDKHFRKEQRGIRLLPNMQFLAKTQTLNKPWEPVFIPKFENYATDPNDLLLCPCRALLAYIKRTEILCKITKTLYNISKESSFKYAYEHANTDTLQFVRAHDTRKLSTSWALFNGLSSQEILKAAHWSNETTFTSYYLKDVPDLESRFAKAAILHTANRKTEEFYNEDEARKYTSNTRMIEIQNQLSERAIELLGLPEDQPCFILDVGCGSGLSGECLTDNGHCWIGVDISPHMLANTSHTAEISCFMSSNLLYCRHSSKKESEGDLVLGDMGDGMPFKSRDI
ncbi:Probable 18S rRNA (guanine-N(7))-methyltransferase,18S rRNA (guanine-N(7))-methyltransferase RID2 [Mytilus coruscus]|uniref:Probable 18S rRNA (Guanine-N(7))-methyltransferase,18S rRNA (Guanine-N(7))-methyltransferase RID2 n=1 Tax=Mytilus coruscus TaxID=42192 RepID=A0A6J8BW20_MYTCO|nr:Probable 18S rRNA (guanine-N(7))-methyltransferase,18S rRNA (guanine-N(7))-methyltransferase RID2 [Mytilus coruscus]